ncbi:MAG: thioredoxin [Lachnospiraceae bacterium]|nr:thioredoxin [Lachnospiraceae bacterium]MBP5745563.1 thioredoxin [Lachnospiraceae bacterium]
MKVELNNNFDEIISSNAKVLVDFYADWCGPCKMVGPLVAQIADEHDDVAVVKVNVDDEMDLAEKFGVASIPTIILFKDGKEAKKNIGAMSKAQLEEFISD